MLPNVPPFIINVPVPKGPTDDCEFWLIPKEICPWVKVVPPEYVLAPDKVNVPFPDLVNAPVPEIIPLNVWLEPEPIARVPEFEILPE